MSAIHHQNRKGRKTCDGLMKPSLRLPSHTIR
jgi:hypothetical protein